MTFFLVLVFVFAPGGAIEKISFSSEKYCIEGAAKINASAEKERKPIYAMCVGAIK